MAEDTIAKAEQFNWRNFWICFLVSLGQIAFGYPSSIIGTTLGEPSFLIYMGVLDPTTELVSGKGEQLIGAMSGVFQVRKHPAGKSPNRRLGILTLCRLVLSSACCFPLGSWIVRRVLPWITTTLWARLPFPWLLLTLYRPRPKLTLVLRSIGYGRKAGVIYCSFFSLLGGAIICGANGVAMVRPLLMRCSTGARANSPNPQ